MTDQRTKQQNDCFHQYLGELADELNAGGYTLQTVVTLPISMTTANVKEHIARRFIEALYPNKRRKDGSFSTTDLDTQEISFLYENMNSAMAEKFGISLQWPDRFNGGKC